MTSVSTTEEYVAVIGMAGRFPGADSVDALWQNLSNGTVSLDDVTDADLSASGLSPSLADQADYVRRCSVLSDISHFDAEYFGITPAEAALIDPQHRIFLQIAVHAFADAGLDPLRSLDRIGVYAGTSMSTYLLSNIARAPSLTDRIGIFEIALGNDKDYFASRVAYHLDLRGPVVGVQSACSTSLVAVHSAVQALLAGECDVALAGGATIRVPHRVGYIAHQGSILSPLGTCRPFDVQADGTVFGNGAGAVILQRFDDALDQNAPIRALIRGSAIANEGRQKAGFTAPSLSGQKSVISEALAISGLRPEDIGFVEAHGTGTRLGDAIELQALTELFEASPARSTNLGALKSNLGHLDAAAGIAGLIKTVKCLETGLIPPHPLIDQLAETLQNPQSPFTVNKTPENWPESDGTVRRAGVSSFGIGGTNAHVILESVTPYALDPVVPGPRLLTFSGPSLDAVERVWLGHELALAALPNNHFSHFVDTSNVAQPEHAYRASLIAETSKDALTQLRQGTIRAQKIDTHEHGYGLLFPGQGSLFSNMGRVMPKNDPVFQHALQAAASALLAPLGKDVLPLCFSADLDQLKRTEITQPVLFAIEYALGTALIDKLGAPAALMGHSAGEFAAATLAGIFTLEDAAKLIVSRGRLMGTLSAGAMCSVDASPVTIQERATRYTLEIALVNAPNACVLAGSVQDVTRFCSEATDIKTKRLATSHAFHTSHMAPILDAFAKQVASVPRTRPRHRLYSCLDGSVPDTRAMDPAYWVALTRETVHFDQAMEALKHADLTCCIEAGPGTDLTALAALNGLGAPVHATLPKNGTGRQMILRAVGQAWQAGQAVHWPSPTQRVPISAFPFARTRHWIDPEGVISSASQSIERAPNSKPRELNPVNLSPAEKIVAGVWSEVMGIEAIGPNEDFIELGGHSLMAVQIISRLRVLLPIELPLDIFFEARTIAKLGTEIEALLSAHVAKMDEQEFDLFSKELDIAQ